MLPTSEFYKTEFRPFTVGGDVLEWERTASETFKQCNLYEQLIFTLLFIVNGNSCRQVNKDRKGAKERKTRVTD
jgi:hypothetical protein